MDCDLASYLVKHERRLEFQGPILLLHQILYTVLANAIPIRVQLNETRLKQTILTRVPMT